MICSWTSLIFESSINIDGQMRVDNNHSDYKQINPNSFAYKFRPDTVEAPYALSDNIVSRKSHFWHEGKKNEYDQARELWSRVMSEQQRQNTIKNTAFLLNRVGAIIIKVSLPPSLLLVQHH